MTFTALTNASGTLPIAVGVTDDQGNFRLQTRIDDAHDGPGARPGEYRVTISKFAPPRGLSEEEYQKKVEADHAEREAKGKIGPSTIPPRKQLLPSEYSDTSKSKLTATVTATGTNQFTFDIP